jgi:hypothetical protein
MNTDERIEALTQSVELLASVHRDLERQTAEHVSLMADAIARLGNIAPNDRDRPGDLEGDRQ